MNTPMGGAPWTASGNGFASYYWEGSARLGPVVLGGPLRTGLRARGECPAGTQWPHAHRQCHQLGPNLSILITNATHISMFENKIPHKSLYFFLQKIQMHTTSFS